MSRAGSRHRRSWPRDRPHWPDRDRRRWTARPLPAPGSGSSVWIRAPPWRSGYGSARRRPCPGPSWHWAPPGGRHRPRRRNIQTPCWCRRSDHLAAGSARRNCPWACRAWPDCHRGRGRHGSSRPGAGAGDGAGENAWGARYGAPCRAAPPAPPAPLSPAGIHNVRDNAGRRGSACWSWRR